MEERIYEKGVREERRKKEGLKKKKGRLLYE